MKNYYSHTDLEKFLVGNGFDKGQLSVLVVNEQKAYWTFFKKDIDDYLTEFGIDKVYLNPDF